MQQAIYRIGSLTYIVLGILALVFYLERTAFLDISFHLFYILKDGDFAIQNNRFAAALTQVFPLVASKLGLGLQSIMQLYSLAFVLLYFSVFLLGMRWSKTYQFGLAMLLFSTLMVTDTFYWIQSEFPQGLALLILFFSLLWGMSHKEASSKSGAYAAMIILLPTLVFVHPLLIFPFFFLLVFFYLGQGIDHRLLFGVGGAFLGLLLIKTLFFRTDYDATAAGGVKNFIYLFPNYFFLASNKAFLKYGLQDYYFLWIGAGIGLLHYLRKKYWLKLGLLAVSLLGYTLLVNVSYPNGAEQFYIENLYLPLSIFVAFPLVFDVLTSWPQKKVLLGLAFVLLIRLVHIGFSHQFYTTRLHYLQEYLLQTAGDKEQKLILSSGQFPKDTLLMTWASPYEFWLLSTISTGTSRSITILDQPEAVEWAKDQKQSFLTQWGVFPYAELPTRYFIFQDSSNYVWKLE